MVEINRNNVEKIDFFYENKVFFTLTNVYSDGIIEIEMLEKIDFFMKIMEVNI